MVWITKCRQNKATSHLSRSIQICIFFPFRCLINFSKQAHSCSDLISDYSKTKGLDKSINDPTEIYFFISSSLFQKMYINKGPYQRRFDQMLNKYEPGSNNLYIIKKVCNCMYDCSCWNEIQDKMQYIIMLIRFYSIYNRPDI